MGKPELLQKIKAAIEEEWPVEQQPKTINLVLVGFEGFALENLYSAISEVPSYIDPWLRERGLKVKRWVLHKVTVKGAAKDYDYWKLTWKLINDGPITMDGENAWYILTAQKTPWPLGGTIGGDWFKQKEGQVPGREGYMRVPGISYADFGCVYALRYNQPPQGSVYPKGRNNVLGWMAHEILHSCALIPCRCGHSTNCVMDQGCYTFPDAAFPCDNCYIVGPTLGDPIAECLRYGFMKRV